MFRSDRKYVAFVYPVIKKIKGNSHTPKNNKNVAVVRYKIEMVQFADMNLFAE